GNAGGKSQIDAAFAHLFRQRQANIVVEAAQKQIAAVELGGAHAQAVKNPGELDTDVAAADDDDARRRALKKKRFVRSDRVFGAGEIFFHRPAPAGDKNIGRGDFFAVDRHGVRIDDLGVAFEDGDAGVAENFSVNGVQPADLPVLVGDELRPIDAPLADGPAVTRGVREIVGVVRRVDQQLFRNAADVHAGAAEIKLLGNRRSGAEGGRHAARAHAARAGADGKKIVVVLGHAKNSFFRIRCAAAVKSSTRRRKSLAAL